MPTTIKPASATGLSSRAATPMIFVVLPLAAFLIALLVASYAVKPNADGQTVLVEFAGP